MFASNFANDINTSPHYVIITVPYQHIKKTSINFNLKLQNIANLQS